MKSINKNHIIIEGIDGSGKSSIIDFFKTDDKLRKLLNSFVKKESDVKYITFDRCPFDEDVSKAIRGLLKNNDNKTYMTSELKSESLLNLFSIDNKLHNEFVKDICCLDSNILITDRSFLSTYAYQTLDNPKEKVLEMIDNSVNQLPGLVIYLNVSPKVSLKRVDSRNEEKEIFEKEETLNKVCSNYTEYLIKLKQENPEITIALIDANQTFDSVKSDIIALIIDYLFMGKEAMIKNKKYFIIEDE